MDVEVCEQCSRESYENSLPFPEVVRRLAAAGVERYYADLCGGSNTYYGPVGPGHTTPSMPEPLSPAAEFDAGAVGHAVRAIQVRAVSYPEFLLRIAAAGVAGYFVCIRGRRAVYMGRTGEAHVEHFPPG
jgi:uncharacterized protein YbcV (DUF1398 family)